MTSPAAPLITCTPGVRSGKPCLAGTRITVADVLEYLASGMTQDDILADFPDLQPAHIQAVLRYAAEREKRLSELTWLQTDSTDAPPYRRSLRCCGSPQ